MWPEMSEDIRWVCREFNIRVAFKSEWTPRSMLTKVKGTYITFGSMWYIISLPWPGLHRRETKLKNTGIPARRE